MLIVHATANPWRAKACLKGDNIGKRARIRKKGKKSNKTRKKMTPPIEKQTGFLWRPTASYVYITHLLHTTEYVLPLLYDYRNSKQN